MNHIVRPESPVLCDLALSEKSRRLHRQMLVERQKLENLIIRQYEKGVSNLGMDIGVLNQSQALDRLLFEIMAIDSKDKRN